MYGFLVRYWYFRALNIGTRTRKLCGVWNVLLFRVGPPDFSLGLFRDVNAFDHITKLLSLYKKSDVCNKRTGTAFS